MTDTAYSYGRASRTRRNECHPDIVMILNTVITEIDMSVLCGIRDETAQTLAFDDGRSRVRWPDSNHNIDPRNPKCFKYPDKSIAVDIGEYHRDVPGGIDWENKQEFWDNAKVVLRIAGDLRRRGLVTYALEWGGDWDGDGIPVYLDKDETFWDGAHFQLAIR